MIESASIQLVQANSYYDVARGGGSPGGDGRLPLPPRGARGRWTEKEAGRPTDRAGLTEENIAEDWAAWAAGEENVVRGQIGIRGADGKLIRAYDFGIRTGEGDGIIGVEVKSGREFKFGPGQREFDNEVMKGNAVTSNSVKNGGLRVVDVLYIWVP